MQMKPQPNSNSARTSFKKWFLTNRVGRLTALVVMALAAAAIVVTTMSLAQTDKPLARMEPAAAARANPVPRKSSPARSKSNRSKRGAARNAAQDQDGIVQGAQQEGRGDRTRADGRPKEGRLLRARPFRGDLRQLPQTAPLKTERPEREGPEPNPQVFVPPDGTDSKTSASAPDISAPLAPLSAPNVPAPSPSSSFEGLGNVPWGAGHPPDTNGDIGPNHYIQTINTSIGVFDKSNGNLITAFTFNTFMSQGAFGNLCDTNNFGDPVVLYDTFEDRWVITDFAFKLDGSGNVVNPPGSFQCIAVSRSGDPVAGGWNFYSINTTGGLGDYPKFGIWPDGLYMSTNMFGYASGAAFQNPRVYAFNKAQMYAGAPSVQSVSFDAPAAEFTLLPSNARLQTGTPPAGSPNYFSVVWQFLNVVSVYKFHVDWNSISTSTFTGPFLSVTPTWWAQFSGANARVPSPANSLDTLYPRLMMQNQYTNIGGVESLWDSHTVGAGNPTSNVSSAQAAVRYYQVKVTGGNVEANATQSFTYSPDATIHRFMTSTAVDRMGDMAIGYSASNATLNPALRYAGRLSNDPVNTITQTETSLLEGTGSQSGSCGGTCFRWGDYSAMTLDPDGCTFWYTNEYYAVTGLNHQTRIGSFRFPQCATVGTGSVQGSVTSTSGGGPINGATVALGSRSTTTDSSGFYQFSNLPAGTYPTISASFSGYSSASVSSLVVNQGSITTQNFALSPGTNNGCFTDTSQADFQTGIPTTVDLTTSPGNVSLPNTANVDQQNTTLGNQGAGFNTTTWLGQTFTAAVTGQLTRVDINFFSLNCSSVSMPNLTVSIRNASGNLPTGADLAVATIPGFCNGAGGYFTANFASPPTLTAGTQYAIVWRAAAAIPGGSLAPGYFGTVSAGTGSVSLQNPYAGGRRASSSTSGATWAGASGNANNDHGFITYMKTGFASPGNLVSSAKDANPHTSGAVTWSTLSWNAATPAATAVKFQIAGSNNASGPFNFVGPDGTAATFFTTSGASLSQFNGLRYLKYKAILSTTNNAVTPTLNDVTVCFSNTVPTTLAVGSANGTYGGTVNLSATLTDGVSPLSGKTINFTLNGNSVGSAVTNGSGVASLSNASLAGINAGPYPTGVGASFAGDPTYLNSSATNSLTVNKANAAINVIGYSVTYDGNPHLATGTATGVNSEVLTGLNLSGTTHTNAGAYAADPWTFSDVNGNYNDANGAVSDAIAKANANITVTPYSVTYDGNPHTAAGTATGVQSESLSGLDLIGTTHTNAASYPGDSWTFTDVTGNYNNSGGTVDDSIAKANANITVTPYNVTYDGNPHTATGTATGAQSEPLSGLNLSGTTHTNAGVYTGDPWTFTDGTGNYNNASGSVDDSIGKANPNINVTPYNVTYDGNPHTATGIATGAQNEPLSGLSLSGTTHTNAGNYAGDPWTFTDGTGNYNNASGTVTDHIGKANPNITVNGYTGVYDGNTHGASGSATGVNNEDLSALLNLGSSFTNVPGGTAHWTFNTSNTNGNYNSASGNVPIVITKATPVFSSLSSPSIGCPATTTVLSGKISLGFLIPTGSVAITLNSVTQNASIQSDGSFSSTFATGSLTPASSPQAITYSYGGDGNFNSINGGGTLTIVDSGAPTITLNGNAILIWPPNKSFRTVNVTDLVASAGDACDTSVNLNGVVIAKVTSDEGASSSGDIVIAANCKSVQLRADRNGNGDGRVYTITFRVRDTWGNATTATAKVTVPHDQGNGINAVDSGIAYTVNSSCP
jgi:hypothetical protein